MKNKIDKLPKLSLKKHKELNEKVKKFHTEVELASKVRPYGEPAKVDLISSESFGIDEISIVLGTSLKKIITDGGNIDICMGTPKDEYRFTIILDEGVVETCYEVGKDELGNKAQLTEELVIGHDMNVEEISTYIAASIRQGLKDGFDMSAYCFVTNSYVFDFEVFTNESKQYIIDTTYLDKEQTRECTMEIRRD